MVLVQLNTKFILLLVLVLFAINSYANNDEIIVKIPTRQFPEWQQLSFTSLIP